MSPNKPIKSSQKTLTKKPRTSPKPQNWDNNELIDISRPFKVRYFYKKSKTDGKIKNYRFIEQLDEQKSVSGTSSSSQSSSASKSESQMTPSEIQELIRKKSHFARGTQKKQDKMQTKKQDKKSSQRQGQTKNKKQGKKSCQRQGQIKDKQTDKMSDKRSEQIKEKKSDQRPEKIKDKMSDKRQDKREMRKQEKRPVIRQEANKSQSQKKKPQTQKKTQEQKRVKQKAKRQRNEEKRQSYGVSSSNLHESHAVQSSNTQQTHALQSNKTHSQFYSVFEVQKDGNMIIQESETKGYKSEGRTTECMKSLEFIEKTLERPSQIVERTSTQQVIIQETLYRAKQVIKVKTIDKPQPKQLLNTKLLPQAKTKSIQLQLPPLAYHTSQPQPQDIPSQVMTQITNDFVQQRSEWFQNYLKSSITQKNSQKPQRIEQQQDQAQSYKSEGEMSLDGLQVFVMRPLVNTSESCLAIQEQGKQLGQGIIQEQKQCHNWSEQLEEGQLEQQEEELEFVEILRTQHAHQNQTTSEITPQHYYLQRIKALQLYLHKHTTVYSQSIDLEQTINQPYTKQTINELKNNPTDNRNDKKNLDQHTLNSHAQTITTATQQTHQIIPLTPQKTLRPPPSRPQPTNPPNSTCPNQKPIPKPNIPALNSNDELVDLFNCLKDFEKECQQKSKNMIKNLEIPQLINEDLQRVPLRYDPELEN